MGTGNTPARRIPRTNVRIDLALANLRLGLPQRKRDLLATAISNETDARRHQRHFADGTVIFWATAAADGRART